MDTKKLRPTPSQTIAETALLISNRTIGATMPAMIAPTPRLLSAVVNIWMRALWMVYMSPQLQR